MSEKQGLPPPDPVPAKVPASQEEEDVLKELCTSNGIAYARLGHEGPACIRLESFFSGISRICGLANFPNLQMLCIMGQPQLYKIEGLSGCPRLKELWISECQIQSMAGLESLRNLKKLYLYSNRIRRIEHIENLSNLEVLWLCDNRITVIENLSSLSYLRDLNLAENEIDSIGNSLNGLEQLEKLELSGNPIYSFKDLTNLSKLPSLKELGLKSPNYRASAVGRLCNYATHIMFHLPNLLCLDTYDISSKVIKDLAETTVIKKKMYYNMKVKTAHRNLAKLLNHLHHIKTELQAQPSEHLRTLHKAIKELERESRELSAGDGGDAHESGTESEKDAREAQSEEDKSLVCRQQAKIQSLKDRCQKWEEKLVEIDHYYRECEERLQHATKAREVRMLTELETGGNVRFEEGKASDVWFSSCHDLVLSRFCASDYKDLNVTGIKIHRITRVHNRILRTQFDDSLDLRIDEEESSLIQQPITRSSSYKKYIEYLFWVWDPELPGGLNEPHRVLEEGFMDADTYKQMGRDNAVPFTNSLYLADRHRIKHTKKMVHNKEYTDSCPVRHGHLVVAKVYTGQSAQCTDYTSLIDRNNYPKPDSLYRVKKDRSQSKTENGAGAEVKTGQCDCSHRQCEWFIFEKSLTMPEYIIDFEYTTRFKPKSPFALLTEGLLSRKDYRQLCQPDELAPDHGILTMSPQVKPRPRLVTLTEELLLKTTKQSSLLGITELNLHDNGLTKLKHLQSLPALRRLIVSFNELSRLDDVSHLNIEYLDASFNKITTLEGFKNLSKLKYLDVSWNRLQNTRDDVSILRKHAPILSTLNVTHNAWQKQEGLRLRAIGRIKSLALLNDDPVTENEATAALRMAAGSRVSQVSLLAQSRTDTSTPRTLYLDSVAHVLLHHSRNRPDRLTDQDNHWFSKVTMLNLDNQHISKLSNLDRLENLRWASMNNNDITKIEGLDSCYNLEELSLEHNCISRLEGLSKLTKLKKLCLGHNYLQTLDGAGFERLQHLQYLSIESNKICGLFGTQKASALVELYMANNLVENMREVFYLKNLSQLVIVDLYGNPVVASSDSYRLFVIYHLKSLRALDGLTIESTEGAQAKDTFGGRLTQDFVAERLGHANFNEVRELDFPSASIRTVDLGNGEYFTNLRSVNLEHNNMTSLSGLVHLINLRVLCLNHNHIESLLPRPKLPSPAGLTGASRSKPTAQVHTFNMVNSGDVSSTPVLDNLEVLHLGYNNIKDMMALQLNRLPSLKALFLQGNEITKVDGLEGLHDLRELVLDRNKIKAISDFSFVNQWNLQELHIEENRIKDLNNFHSLENLQRLFLGSNRIQDVAELEKIGSLGRLLELSVANNAVARRMLHRPMLVYRMPQLVVIDGIPVTEEERNKAELYFIEQQPPSMTTTIETTLPGIGQYKTHLPVKVTNMQLMSGPYYDKTWGGTIHFSEEAIQDVQRGGGRKRPPNRMEAALTGTAKPTLSYHQQSGRATPPTIGYQGNTRSQHQVSQVPYVPQGHSTEQNDLRPNRNGRR